MPIFSCQPAHLGCSGCSRTGLVQRGAAQDGVPGRAPLPLPLVGGRTLLRSVLGLGGCQHRRRHLLRSGRLRQQVERGSPWGHLEQGSKPGKDDIRALLLLWAARSAMGPISPLALPSLAAFPGLPPGGTLASLLGKLPSAQLRRELDIFQIEKSLSVSVAHRLISRFAQPTDVNWAPKAAGGQPGKSGGAV